MKFNIEWTHEVPVLTQEQQDIVDKEINFLSEQMDHAGDLIFHTIFLEKDACGATVAVDGCDDTLFLTYYEKTKWVPLEFDLEDDE
jgi:hypothetical protein